MVLRSIEAWLWPVAPETRTCSARLRSPVPATQPRDTQTQGDERGRDPMLTRLEAVVSLGPYPAKVRQHETQLRQKGG